VAKVGRYVKMTAREGMRDELAAALLRAADGLAGTPGCELYVINASPTDPSAVWVTEIWASQATVDASLAAIDREDIATVLALLAAPPERIDTLPLGGKGLAL
jgi:quinol monooxygenase YgiN